MADWVSKIKLQEKREKEIKQCFEGTAIDFHYLDSLSDFNILIVSFQCEDIVNEENDNFNKNILGEKKIDRIIVMDDVSSLADKSNEFNSFLTLSRKFVFMFFIKFFQTNPSGR